LDEAHEDTTEFGYKFRHSMDGEGTFMRCLSWSSWNRSR